MHNLSVSHYLSKLLWFILVYCMIMVINYGLWSTQESVACNQSGATRVVAMALKASPTWHKWRTKRNRSLSGLEVIWEWFKTNSWNSRYIMRIIHIITHIYIYIAHTHYHTLYIYISLYIVILYTIFGGWTSIYQLFWCSLLAHSHWNGLKMV